MAKDRPRLLMILPWLTVGAADKFNLDLVQQATRRGWEVSIATTEEGRLEWMPLFAESTPDAFALHHFLEPRDHPRFLTYLIGSRRPDVVLVSNSLEGYLLLPYLNSQCPEPAFVSFTHQEEDPQMGGGCAGIAAGCRDLLDANIVSTEHLQRWMVGRGCDLERVEVCTTNVDSAFWAPDTETRRRVREELQFTEDEPVVVFVGRLTEKKRPRLFVEVIGELRRRGVAIRALIVGDGPKAREVGAAIQRHGLHDVIRRVGAVPPQRARPRAGRRRAPPSEHPRGLGPGPLRGYGRGPLRRRHRRRGHSELVTPECGLLLPVRGDEHDLSRYADALADLLRDPARRAQMGRRARQRVFEGFTLDAMGGDRMVPLFERAIERRSRRAVPPLPTALACESARLALETLRLTREQARPASQEQRLQAARELGGRALLRIPLRKAVGRARRLIAARSWTKKSAPGA